MAAENGPQYGLYRGDCTFPAVKQDLLQLHNKFPLYDDVEQEMSMLEIDKSALTISNGVARYNPNAT